MKRVTIIGHGKVGGTLASRLRSKNIEVRMVTHEAYMAWLESGEAIGDVLILAVKDEVMQSTIDKIAGYRAHHFDHVLAIHVNGAHGKDVLTSWATDGAAIAAAHPFQTFADQDPSALDGIGWGVDATDEAWPRVKEFVELTGGYPFRLKKTSDIDKRRYHAAAVAASNFTYAAYELARRLAEDVGLEPDRFLVPIMKRTLENAADAMHDDEAFTITGPIARGDVEGVRKQLAAMPDDAKRLYQCLSIALLDVVSGEIGEEKKAAIRAVLD
jgi:predicted short-subunit dehydrogenase-like oxidoreductase (DUF2520 family)